MPSRDSIGSLAALGAAVKGLYVQAIAWIYLSPLIPTVMLLASTFALYNLVNGVSAYAYETNNFSNALDWAGNTLRDVTNGVADWREKAKNGIQGLTDDIADAANQATVLQNTTAFVDALTDTLVDTYGGDKGDKNKKDEDKKDDDETKPIYRLGNTNARNLTPRQKDVGSGLSMTTTPPSPTEGAWKFEGGRSQLTRLGFIVVDAPTLKDPGHVLVRPVIGSMEEWADYKDKMDNNDPTTWHPLTILLVGIAKKS